MHSKLNLPYKVKCALKYCPYIICIILFSIPIIIDSIAKDHSASSYLATTFGLANKNGSTKDFYTFWIALWGVIGIVINIIHSQIRIQNQDKQIELQSKSQRDSRFSKGIELLGNDNESARTGAAYSLCFLAKDYPDEFSKPVFDILCSHIRTLTTSDDYLEKHRTVSNEVQTILNLLFKDTDGNSTMVFSTYKADLSRANLEQVDLDGANLKEANLIFINLKNAHLDRTNLEEADLKGANFEDALLKKVNLKRADLYDTNFNTIFVIDTDFQGACLLDADLSNSDLKEANLKGTLICSSMKPFLEKRGVDLTGVNWVDDKEQTTITDEDSK